MSPYDETLFDEIVRKSKKILSQAFRTKILQSRTISLPEELSKSSSQSICSVSHSVSIENEIVTVEFLLAHKEVESAISLQASVSASEIGWLSSLAETTENLILREMEMQQQDDLLTEYASQISRDFEELVWTREFAKRIQQTDIRNSLGEFTSHIFPTLRETVQTAQLILVQYQNPISIQGELPAFAEINILTHGTEVLNTSIIEDLVRRYADRARIQPVDCNHCSNLQLNELKSFILVPVQAKAQEFGWMVAINRISDLEAIASDEIATISGLKAAEFGSFEAGLMQSTASFLASHVNNSSLYSEKEDLMIGIVKALANAIDAKDHYTRGHSMRVALVAKRLAEELNLSQQECDEIHLAGLLHDIGKIGVPDHILLKKGKLTFEEMNLLKQHPVIGYQVLQHLKQISYILPGVLHHHESLDGAGYPDGLTGDQIPLTARIIAVADAFDAMTSDRPYRQGMPVDVAESIFSKNEGPQWDPSVVEALFAARDDIHELCELNSYHASEEMNEFQTAQENLVLLNTVSE